MSKENLHRVLKDFEKHIILETPKGRGADITKFCFRTIHRMIDMRSDEEVENILTHWIQGATILWTDCWEFDPNCWTYKERFFKQFRSKESEK